MQQCIDTSIREDKGWGGGLIAALIAFALTWFVVNGEELHDAHGEALRAAPYSVCDLPANIPTSRFLNAPIVTALPALGG